MSVASFHRLTAAQPNLSHDPHRQHDHAFEAIAATLPLDSVRYEPQLNAKGEARLQRARISRCQCFRQSAFSRAAENFAQRDARAFTADSAPEMTLALLRGLRLVVRFARRRESAGSPALRKKFHRSLGGEQF